ncbi:MAG: hypothetical protein SGILL_003600, partial [Bacillariaceae sp.]
IYGTMEDSHIHKDDVMRMLLSIENFKQIRMIRLRPLRQHGPPPAKGEPAVKPEVGGFIGLNWAMGRKLFKEFRSRKKAPPPPPPRKLKVPRRRTSTDSDDDTDSESSMSSSSDDDTSIEDEDDFGDGHFVDIDYDPYDPENIAETTNFYPHPTLDLVSYIDGKDIVNDDRVMDSWAETWGPKISRKKNRKQSILQNLFGDLHRQRNGHLSSNPRLMEPGAEEAMGYTWTLAEDGWNTTLKGDDPQWELIPKIVKTAKTDPTMVGCRLLFEIKNPGYKTLSRSYGYSSKMSKSVFDIPKTSVLAKITNAREAERTTEAKEKKQQAVQRAAAENLLAFAGSSSEKKKGSDSLITPIDEMSVEKIKMLDSKSLSAHLIAYGQEKVPRMKKARKALLERLVQEHIKQTERLTLLTSVAQDYDPENVAAIMLEQFADAAILRGVRELFDDPIETKEFDVREDLPPFTASWKHVDFDLSGTDDFPRELYRLVQDAESLVITHLISWQEKGKSFAVHDKNGFEQIILSECTGETAGTYESFVANLSTFGFSEIEKGHRKGGYRHEFFRRKRPGDVALISRVDDDFSDDDDSSDADDHTSDEASSVDNGSSSAKPDGYNLSKINDFPNELHRLLEDAEESITEFVHWLPGGKSFAISNDEMFTRKVLRVHSKNTTIASFEASLFNFGFKKIRKTGKNKHRRYQHSKFVKGQPEELSGISFQSGRILSGTSKSTRRVQEKPATKSRKLMTPEPKSRKRKTPAPKPKQMKKSRVAASTKSRTVEVSTVASPEPSTSKKAVTPHQRRNNFADSLRQMLNDIEDSSVVSWLPDGGAFKVSNPEVFEASTIPKYFSSMPYPSFRRELKALGFEPFGTTSHLKNIMFHGLFHRDFPDLWKLHEDNDLTEKVEYCLSQDKKLLEELMEDGEAKSSSGSTKDKITWKEFPALENFLYTSIGEHFVLLSANSTKLQRELYKTLTQKALEIAKTESYKLDESIDDLELLSCLRSFFRPHFVKVRKQVQFMKTNSEQNLKATLQSLIHRAEPIDLNDLEAMEVATIDRPLERPDVTAQGHDDSAVESDHQPVSRKRKAAPMPGKKSKPSASRVKQKKRPKRSISNRAAEQSVVSPGPQTVNSPATNGAANSTGQGIEHSTLQAVDTALFQSNSSALVGMLRGRHGLPASQQASTNQGEVPSTSLPSQLIHTFPIKSLDAYLAQQFPPPHGMGFDGSNTSREEEMKCAMGLLEIDTAEALQEQFPRLELYVRLLRSVDGSLWYHNLLDVPLHVQMEYLYKKLMDCFFTTDFQGHILVQENPGDALQWHDFYKQIKAERQLNNLEALHLLNNSPSRSLQLQLLNEVQASQQQQQDGSSFLQQQEHGSNQFRSLAASLLVGAAATNPRGTVPGVATPSPPVDIYNRDQDGTRVNLADMMAAVAASPGASGISGPR